MCGADEQEPVRGPAGPEEEGHEETLGDRPCRIPNINTRSHGATSAARPRRSPPPPLPCVRSAPSRSCLTTPASTAAPTKGRRSLPLRNLEDAEEGLQLCSR